MLNHILAALYDFVIAFDLEENKYSFISNNITELTGYQVRDFESDHDLWNKLIDPRDIERLRKLHDEIEEGRHTEFTYRIKSCQGKIRWVNEKRSLFTEVNSNKKILVSIIKDIEREDEAKYNREESMAGYNILFDNNPNPMWIYDLPTLRILKVNNAAIKTYGYTEEEFLTMTLYELRPESEKNMPDDRDHTNELLQGFGNVRKLLTKEGDIIYTEINSDNTIYKNYEGRLVIAANVTEKIRWREEVKLREQFLNSLIDSQTNFLIRIDNKGNFTFVNRQFLKTFGYENAEVIGKHYDFTTIPEERYLCENAFIECINNPGKVIRLIHKKQDKWGNLHDTEWEFIAIKDEEGNFTGAQGIGQDITEKINSEKEITRTKNTLEALINNTEDLIWSVNRDYKYLYMNHAYKNVISGYSGLAPVKGDDALHRVFDENTLEMWKTYYMRCFNGERYLVMTENYDPASQSALYYETSFNPIYNAEGVITGVGCFSRDITERVRVNKDILEKNDRLQKIASLSSHELRRPVATMLGLLNIIDQNDFYNPENKQIIEHLLTVGIEIDDTIRLIVDNTSTFSFPDNSDQKQA